MANSPYVRSLIVQAALDIVPPSIRASLLEDSGFVQDYGIKLDSTLSLREADISFRRSDLFDAARKVLSDAPRVELNAADETKWVLEKSEPEAPLPVLVLSRDDQHLVLPDLSPLAADVALRLRALDLGAFDVNLPIDVHDHWRRTLAQRPLDDDEVDEYWSEFRDTPVATSRALRAAIVHRQELGISDLVPTSRRYYERLVGTYDGSISPREYAVRGARTHLEGLHQWQAYEGFLFSLLLSSHPAMTSEIDVDPLSAEDLVRAFESLADHGDPISQLGAIEVGLRILAGKPGIESVLVRLVEQIRDDDPDRKTSRFGLFSALFFLVDGELSRARVFSAEPPYYRRLASLAQAALIQRQATNSGVDAERLSQWAFTQRSEQFYMQSLVDMRQEPRWNPEYAVTNQVKCDFLARIMGAARVREESLKISRVLDVVLGDEPSSIQSQSLHSHRNVIRYYLPGPLEGLEESQIALSPEIAAAIQQQLGAEELTPASFVALVNSALLFRISTGEVELAEKALKLGSYRLARVDSEVQLMSILEGLGTVAAITRTASLAEDVRILVRRYSNDAAFRLSAQEAIKVCLISAASHTQTEDWRRFVGEWLTELAFGDLEAGEAAIIESRLQCLLIADPGLWATCGTADAALVAYQTSLHGRQVVR